MYLSIYHTVQFQYNFGTHPMSVYKFDNAENKFGNICGFRYMIISHNLFRIFCAYIYIHHMVSHLYMNGFCFSNNCMCVCEGLLNEFVIGLLTTSIFVNVRSHSVRGYSSNLSICRWTANWSSWLLPLITMSTAVYNYWMVFMVKGKHTPLVEYIEAKP